MRKKRKVAANSSIKAEEAYVNGGDDGEGENVAIVTETSTAVIGGVETSPTGEALTIAPAASPEQPSSQLSKSTAAFTDAEDPNGSFGERRDESDRGAGSKRTPLQQPTTTRGRGRGSKRKLETILQQPPSPSPTTTAGTTIATTATSTTTAPPQTAESTSEPKIQIPNSSKSIHLDSKAFSTAGKAAADKTVSTSTAATLDSSSSSTSSTSSSIPQTTGEYDPRLVKASFNDPNTNSPLLDIYFECSQDLLANGKYATVDLQTIMQGNKESSFAPVILFKEMYTAPGSMEAQERILAGVHVVIAPSVLAASLKMVELQSLPQTKACELYELTETPKPLQQGEITRLAADLQEKLSSYEILVERNLELDKQLCASNDSLASVEASLSSSREEAARQEKEIVHLQSVVESLRTQLASEEKIWRDKLEEVRQELMQMAKEEVEKLTAEWQTAREELEGQLKESKEAWLKEAEEIKRSGLDEVKKARDEQLETVRRLEDEWGRRLATEVKQWEARLEDERSSSQDNLTKEMKQWEERLAREREQSEKRLVTEVGEWESKFNAQQVDSERKFTAAMGERDTAESVLRTEIEEWKSKTADSEAARQRDLDDLNGQLKEAECRRMDDKSEAEAELERVRAVLVKEKEDEIRNHVHECENKAREDREAREKEWNERLERELASLRELLTSQHQAIIQEKEATWSQNLESQTRAKDDEWAAKLHAEAEANEKQLAALESDWKVKLVALSSTLRTKVEEVESLSQEHEKRLQAMQAEAEINKKESESLLEASEKKREQLDSELALAKTTVTEMKTKFEEITMERKTLQLSLDEKNSTITELKGQLESSVRDLEELRLASNRNLESVKVDLESRITNLTLENGSLTGRCQDGEAAIKASQEQLQAAEVNMIAAVTEIAQLKQALSTVADQKTKLESDLIQSVDFSQKRAEEIASAKIQYEGDAAANRDLQGRIQRLMAIESQLRSENSTQKTDKERLQRENAELQGKLESLQKSYLKTSDECKGWTKKFSEADAKHKTMEMAWRDQVAQITKQHQQQLQQLQNSYLSLQQQSMQAKVGPQQQQAPSPLVIPQQPQQLLRRTPSGGTPPDAKSQVSPNNATASGPATVVRPPAVGGNAQHSPLQFSSNISNPMPMNAATMKLATQQQPAATQGTAPVQNIPSQQQMLALQANMSMMHPQAMHNMQVAAAMHQQQQQQQQQQQHHSMLMAQMLQGGMGMPNMYPGLMPGPGGPQAANPAAPGGFMFQGNLDQPFTGMDFNGMDSTLLTGGAGFIDLTTMLDNAPTTKEILNKRGTRAAFFL
ncbi:hypothetical protein HDU76_002793 [Blyttiomyces sp. JEL0837]|nr:hypothetical protein HDU76_002793 [Blyttiomyces sp. JEL0837]